MYGAAERHTWGPRAAVRGRVKSSRRLKLLTCSSVGAGGDIDITTPLQTDLLLIRPVDTRAAGWRSEREKNGRVEKEL